VTGPGPSDARVRPYDPGTDEGWAESFLDDRIGGRRQARRGEVVDVLAPGLGFVAEAGGQRTGLLTYRLEADDVELSAFAVVPRRAGLGTRLLAALEDAVRAAGRARIWVVTTNDNVDALRFYQRRGFRIREIRVGAVDRARAALKPAIGRLGEHGIPLRDEIELVRDLASSD
jgi:ribosomal protein S18 acetylase RimI-like enzyme